MLKCPKCYEELRREGGCYRCDNGHSYDISKEGYVNLMLANMKHSKEPGDSPESLRSREAFLNKGYYQPLAEELTNIINSYIKEGSSFLDAGCGTGYYLDFIMRNIDKKIDFYATDIAKKGAASNMGPDVYHASLYSYTRRADYEVYVSKKYLNENDKVLIIDDFLANGDALNALIKICEQAGCELVGCGVVIEKAMQSAREGKWLDIDY